MIVLSDIRTFLSTTTHVVAKSFDLPNPPVATLEEIAGMAGMRTLPQTVSGDASTDVTVAGNFNDGFYGVPKHLAGQGDIEWRC
ncbi:hypothetical protein [Burkholderia territorii]|uniref:hypothetical protein n=1 Tax=Burkholderia territorii TaxID=1503055 RepID=UPI000B0DCE9E|nr:hypothetical protein [Burkholderia territorii]